MVKPMDITKPSSVATSLDDKEGPALTFLVMLS